MTWPAAATKVHLDSATDDPSQARVELAELIDKFNALITEATARVAALDSHAAAVTGAEHGAVSTNTANKIVRRDASGNISVGAVNAKSANITDTGNEQVIVQGSTTGKGANIKLVDASQGTTPVKRIRSLNGNLSITSNADDEIFTLTDSGALALASNMIAGGAVGGNNLFAQSQTRVLYGQTTNGDTDPLYRNTGVAYTNSTYRPIEVTISWARAGSNGTIIVEFETIQLINFPFSSTQNGGVFSFVVPPNTSYRLNYDSNFSINKWAELR